MSQCVGLTQKGKQCKTSGINYCLQCEAYLCSWHVLYKNGARCPWCLLPTDIRWDGRWGVVSALENRLRDAKLDKQKPMY